MTGCKPSRSRRPRTLDLNRQRYRELVAARGWKTQKQQAEALGLGQHTISKVVESEARPGPRVIAALLTAFPEEGFDNLFEIVDDLPLRRVAA